MEENSLKAKEDGRKKAWWVKKIEALEAELATKGDGVNGNYNEVYAEGFVDAMHRFQIRNKAARRQIKHQIVTNGPGAVKRIRGAIF